MKVTKRVLAVLVTVVMMLGVVPVMEASAATTVQITYAGQVIDTFNGVSAIYRTGLNDNSDTTYSCAAFVKKYYNTVYHVDVWNLLTGKTPSAGSGSFSQTSSPEPGDIGYQTNSSGNGHWFIIKSVSGSTYIIIEQNWKWQSNGSYYCTKERQVTTSTSGFKAFRWSNKPSNPSSSSQIEGCAITYADNTGTGIDPMSNPTLRDNCKFWFVKHNPATYYYINIYLDNTLVIDHCSTDSNGFVSYVADLSYIRNGQHSVRADLVTTASTYSATIPFIANNYIDFWAITKPDNSNAGVDYSSTPTLSGQYKFWFKRVDSDSNHFVNIFVDDKQVVSHGSVDSNGYTAYTVNTATLSNGKHSVKCVYVNTMQTFTSIKEFNVSNPYYYLDLNGWLDGAKSSNLGAYGTADIYINGKLVANDVSDHWQSYAKGTTYEIKDIKSKNGYQYNGVQSGSLSGTINGDVAVTLNFSRKATSIFFNENHDNINPNLFVINHGEKTENGLTYSYDSTADIITLNGKLTGSVDLLEYPFKASGGDVYKLTATKLSGSVSDSYLVIEFFDRDGARVYFDIADSMTRDLTISAAQAAKINRVRVWVWCHINSVYNNAKFRIKLEKIASASAAATAHSHAGIVKLYNDSYNWLPTATRDGYEFDGWYTAASGGTKITTSSKCTTVGQQTLYAHWKAHNWNSGTVTKTATCSATGVKTYTCTTCNATKTETIPVNSSNHANTTNVTATPSTCTAHGYTAGVYCNDCKKYINGHVEKPLAAHTLTVINQRDATYDADGYTGDQYCTTCQQTITTGTAIPKLVRPTDPQPQPSGGCKWCGKTHGGAFGWLVKLFHNLFAAIFGAKY